MADVIIFIHGIGSNKGTWSQFIESLKEDFDTKYFQEYEPNITKINPSMTYYYLYDYKSKIINDNFIKRFYSENIEGTLSNGQISINQHTQTFENDLDNLVSEFKTINIIAHSMGGIITMNLLFNLLNNNTELCNKITKCILLGSPLYGSDEPKKLKKLLRLDITTDVLKELSPDSNTIIALKQKIENLSDKLKADFKILYIAGDTDSRIIPLDKFIVNKFGTFTQISGGHSDIIKTKITSSSFIKFKKFILATTNNDDNIAVDNCPYNNPEIFYNNMYEFVNKTIKKLALEYKELRNEDLSSKILSERINDSTFILPSILLLRGDIVINKNLDKTLDYNRIDKKFIDIIVEKCNKTIEDNPTFRLSSITPINTLHIGESSYSKSFSTCDKHFYNFIDINNTEMINETGENYKFWYSELKNLILNENFKSISGSLACSTLVVFKNFKRKKYQYLIMDNSKKKNGNKSRHVIPSFMFQPPKDDTQLDNNFSDTLDIKFQMFKEFAEEILGHIEYEKINNGELLKDTMANNPILQKLSNLLKTNQAEFKILGLSLDMFRLRPEILSVLIIENQDFLDDINKSFGEQASRRNTDSNQGITAYASFEVDKIVPYDIENEKRYFEILTNIETPIVPPGAACLKLGRDYVLKNYINK